MIDLSNLDGNVTFIKFCGMTDENGTCSNEAVGEISLEKDGEGIPICEEHLEEFSSQIYGEAECQETEFSYQSQQY